MRLTNGFACSDSDKADSLADSFYKYHTLTINTNCKNSITNTVNRTIKTFSKNGPDYDSFQIVSPNEIATIIKNLKSNKAPGFDNIGNIVLKRLPRKAIILLSKIFNGCLSLGYFPEQWKVAKVLPLPKPGKDNKISVNYRPISLLPSISKLLERVILTRLKNQLDDKILHEQFGFRETHSTVHQLTRLTEHISGNFNVKRSTGMVLLDIEKAFDTVWHDGLIYKLITMDVPSYIVRILQSYLTKRQFVVSVKDTLSAPKFIPAGVPQGSILGPYLFSVFINDIPIPKNCNIALYADDTACYTSSRSPNLIIKNLQNGLVKLNKYFTKWKIKLNNSKAEAIFFTHRRSKLPTKNLQLGSQLIEWKPSVKYLGVKLDTKLKWTSHIKDIKAKGAAAMSTLYPIFNRHSFLSPSNKLLLYKTMIRPILTYAAPVWSNTCVTNYKQLQVIQNKCLKISFNTPLYTNLSKLHNSIELNDIKTFCRSLTHRFYSKLKDTHTNPLIKCLGNYDSTLRNFKYIHKMPNHILLFE